MVSRPSLYVTSYPCPDCNAQGVGRGFHAVTCVGSGGHTRGHNALRDTLALILADLGISVAKEQGLNDGSGLVPADLLVSTWAQGKPCAIDVSIVVSAELTTRGGSSIRSAEDDRAASKMHKYKGLCTTKQWNYQPFVADVYGALSSQARTLLSHYMDSKLNPTVKANPGRQWHRMQSMDNPALLPLNCLDWVKRQKQAIFGKPLDGGGRYWQRCSGQHGQLSWFTA